MLSGTRSQGFLCMRRHEHEHVFSPCGDQSRRRDERTAARDYGWMAVPGAVASGAGEPRRRVRTGALCRGRDASARAAACRLRVTRALVSSLPCAARGCGQSLSHPGLVQMEEGRVSSELIRSELIMSSFVLISARQCSSVLIRAHRELIASSSDLVWCSSDLLLVDEAEAGDAHRGDHDGDALLEEHRVGDGHALQRREASHHQTAQ
mmetsp:Transcript_62518/g.171696  ORF Transcript_62518/g.171696 Transcript_62518/m.171696 type:complete len:208 (-) Transcript_62518:537-1160(-)